jgi:tRNA(Ile)-lysidine synthetase-like protein
MIADILLNRVRAILDQQALLRHDAHIVAAVSGGPDSLCLAHVLWRLMHAGGPGVHIAHLDHGFRGAQSADEARFVAATADQWGIPATVAYRDVPALAQARRQNAQAAARAIRYAFLQDVARDTQADAVAVAHHANDQAETVLLHLLHGAGPAGLRGMRLVVPWAEWSQQADADDDAASHRPSLIRPLLDSTRAEIEHYCAEHNLCPREDPSNASPSYTRSRIRSDLLPALSSYNQQIVAALSRTARVCADDYAYIQTQLDRLWPDLVAERHGAISFQTEAWAPLPASLQRYALRRAAWQLTEADDLSYEHIEAGRAASTQGAGHQQTLANGLLLRTEHGRFLLIHEPEYAPDAAAQALHSLPQLHSEVVALAVPGITSLSAAWDAETSYQPLEDQPADKPWCWYVALDADRLDSALFFRRRHPGDRFWPAGGAGSRRIQDFFVDHKIPRELRAAWPLLATSSSIVWVAGLRADERFRTTSATQRIMWVALRRRTSCTRISNTC